MKDRECPRAIMGYRLTQQAGADVVNLYLSGLEQFGIAQTDRYHSGLEKTFQLLSENPRMGRERPEFRVPVRMHPFRSHIIIYQIENKDILIIRVRHGHEDWISNPI